MVTKGRKVTLCIELSPNDIEAIANLYKGRETETYWILVEYLTDIIDNHLEDITADLNFGEFVRKQSDEPCNQ